MAKVSRLMRGESSSMQSRVKGQAALVPTGRSERYLLMLELQKKAVARAGSRKLPSEETA